MHWKTKIHTGLPAVGLGFDLRKGPLQFSAAKRLGWPLFTMLALSVCAQTNLLISFTNAAGNFVPEAKVVKIFPNKIIYLTASGGGIARLGDLPPALQRRFGFNPTNAATADAKDELDEQARDQAIYDNQLLASQQFQVEALRNRVFQTSRIIWGRVVQKLPGGLLVDSGQQAVAGVVRGEPEFEANGNMTTTHKTEADESKEPGAECKGLVFLADYPQYSSAVTGDYVQILAYQTGEYSYRPASGGQKTARKFTADFEKAVAMLSEQ
jgi:hypothetical protein